VVMIDALIIISTNFYAFARSLFYLYRLQSYDYHATFKLKPIAFNCLVSLALATAVVTEKYLSVVGVLIFSTLLLLIGVLLLIAYYSSRKRFKFTARGIRVSLPYFLCIFALNVTFSLVFNGFIRLLCLTLTAFISEYILFIMNSIIAPLERKRNYAYAMRNSRAVRESDLIKIVITGSFGKTSCKNILLKLLEEKYSVFTPSGNMNTPMGISRYIAKLPAGFSESEKPVIFLAEAGARRRGDVKDICRLIGVNYGIITGVCDQHLDTFRTTENIKKAKQELADFIGANGVVVFNGDNEHTLKMSKEYPGKSIVVGEKNGNVKIENLRSTILGTSFNLVTESGVVALKTSLLGRHNAFNVALAVALAIELGIEKESVKKVVESLEPVPHRLELIKANNLSILDDGYNANERGVMLGLELVSTYPGRKVVYAQGVVECGLKKKKINLKIGQKVGEIADVIILSGENAKYIRRGILSSGYKGKIYHFKNILHAKREFGNILKGGDLLYLQNDIP